MRQLNYYLKKIYKKWQDIMDSIITGECGCIKTCTLYYKDPNELEDCESYNQTNSDHSYSDECNYKLLPEELDIAVFTDEKKFIRIENVFNLPSGTIQTITNLENFEKLKQCEFVEFNTNDSSLIKKRYKRYSDGQTVGFNDTYKYYILLWEKI